MNKKCTKCFKEKSFSDFHKRSSSKDSLQSLCKECSIKLNKYRYKKKTKEEKQKVVNSSKRKREELVTIVNNFKKLNRCCFCDEKHVCCLDYHHLDPNNKEFEIGYLARAKSVNKIIDEIKKCVIVCANCHRKLHADILTLDTLPKYDYSSLIDALNLYKEKYKRKKKADKKCIDCRVEINKCATRCRQCSYKYLSSLHKKRGTKPPTRTKTKI